jgi:hypothetical protein
VLIASGNYIPLDVVVPNAEIRVVLVIFLILFLPPAADSLTQLSGIIEPAYVSFHELKEAWSLI